MMDIPTIKILLIGNDKESCEFIATTLSKIEVGVTFQIQSSEDIAASRELLIKQDFDVVLLDLELSKGSIIEALKGIGQTAPNIAIIVLTAVDDEESGLDAIRNGADDYLIKGKLFKDTLSRSIRYSVERKKEQKKSEESLAKLIENLRAINKELNDFAYITSHDLKAPLRGIKTLAEWLAADYSDKLGEKGKEQLSMLVSRVDRMHNLIEGILNYSRIGRNKEIQAAINLNTLVAETIETICCTDKKSEIKIIGELPTIICDQTRITQVFQNLISNALKFNDKPECEVNIGCKSENGLWKFSISDNGPGIPEKDSVRIFEIFQTLAPRDTFESTGIGLTIVKKIIEIYGGKIWVESKMGEGSTFYFTIPQVNSETTLTNKLVKQETLVIG